MGNKRGVRQRRSRWWARYGCRKEQAGKGRGAGRGAQEETKEQSRSSKEWEAEECLPGFGTVSCRRCCWRFPRPRPSNRCAQTATASPRQYCSSCSCYFSSCSWCFSSFCSLRLHCSPKFSLQESCLGPAPTCVSRGPTGPRQTHCAQQTWITPVNRSHPF